MKNPILYILLMFLSISCSRSDENDDVLSQEEISNVILLVKDNSTGNVATYDYVVNSIGNPKIVLADGKDYTVNVRFRNGTEDITEEIIDERDEHFMIFNFVDSQISLTRTDAEVRTDGNRLGIETQWNVQQSLNGTSPRLILTLIHDAPQVSEMQNGGIFGSTDGGETDAVATFEIIN